MQGQAVVEINQATYTTQKVASFLLVSYFCSQKERIAQQKVVSACQCMNTKIQ